MRTAAVIPTTGPSMAFAPKKATAKFATYQPAKNHSTVERTRSFLVESA